MQDTTRIVLVIDVPTEQLVEAYDGHHTFKNPIGADAPDLYASLAARLDEFYPGKDGYATPLLVAAVVVDDDTPLDASTLKGIYEVGVEGVDDAPQPCCEGFAATNRVHDLRCVSHPLNASH